MKRQQPPPVIPPGRAFAALATRVRALERLTDWLVYVAIGALLVALLAVGMAAAALKRATPASCDVPLSAMSVDQ